MNSAGQEESGRVRQKRRTRNLLLQTAAGLIARGEVPTVTAVADAAEVSRRTAYRYFPTQEQLLADASLERLRPRVERIVESAQSQFDAATALEYTVGQIQKLSFEHEDLLRAMLRFSMDRKLGHRQPGPDQPVRGRRRVDWIESALSTVKSRLRKKDYQRLVSALTLCIGIESLVTLQDVRGLSPEQSIQVCRWTARALLETALRAAGSD
ncbi:MAG: TetR/AcrR family transcriptional regulator [Acidobacteria bacterium]|nr:TetR/AcrR family transcriptional regulator [Acidobacteriota bacterium]